MTLVTLSDVLNPALANNSAVAGLVVLGWEDARAFVAAAEAENAPVILQAGPACRAHTPLPILGKMFQNLAEGSSVPVVAHLDHGYSAEDCRIAIDSGFTSVMFDGSRKPLAENIDETGTIAEMAHAAGASIEGEIGFVGYSGGEESSGTDPEDAAAFAAGTGVDAMAISVGNVHLKQSKGADIDLDLLRRIEEVTTVPLVLHGGSGISDQTRRTLATTSKVCKFNIGTELRMAFGHALRAALDEDTEVFDRIQILKQTHDPVCDVARSVIRTLKPEPYAS